MLQHGKLPLIARFRRSARYFAADALHYSGLFKAHRWLRQGGARGNPVCVLGLHRVLKEVEFRRTYSVGSIVIREGIFVGMLEHLCRNFRIVSLQDFIRGEKGNGEGGKPSCLITFDDGWEDNYANAYPWLRKLGLPAVIFLVTRMIGSKDTFWGERLACAWKERFNSERFQAQIAKLKADGRRGISLEQAVEFLKHMPAEKREEILADLLKDTKACVPGMEVDGMMNWEQVLEMSRGGVDFGAHTETHPLLVYESDATVERELCDCKKTIEEKVGAPVTAFAFPNGSWDQRVRSLVEKAGYLCAFSTRAGWHRPTDDLFTVSRVLLHEGNVTGRDGKFSPAIFDYTLARGF
jgi:peptidoglycan/xylan/chitin deacetylase (PgdA/CDA1 family)